MLYLNIITAACCANCTNQNASTVPIASVPAAAIHMATHDIQLILELRLSLTTTTAVFAVPAVAFGFTATAAAPRLRARAPVSPLFAEIFLLLLFGARAGASPAST